MAEQAVRRGLPRTRGGEPWPPAATVTTARDVAAVTEAAPPTAAARSAAVAPATPAAEGSPATIPVSPAAPAPVAHDVPAVSSVSASGTAVPTVPAAGASAGPVRRGLPRTPGGEAWPPAGAAPMADAVMSPAATAEIPVPEASTPAALPVASVAAPAVPPAVPDAVLAASSPPVVRRGLPRTPGGDLWPPEGLAPVVAEAVPVDAAVVDAAVPAAGVVVPASPAREVAVRDVSVPLSFPRTVWRGVAPRHDPGPADPEGRKRPTYPVAGGLLLAAAGLGLLAGMAVVFVRWLLTLDFMVEFLVRFPGEYHLPEWAPVGIPGWVGWQHFFNVFLMVLIIRSGITIRREKRPTAYWTPKRDAQGKVSLTIWFHQALDVLWLVNGVIFVVLLFVSAHWVRLVPTSWEVFPNALSALLQYVSFDWPTENGWVNYNSLQQIMYFLTVFVAAPLAAVTGVRMSGLWPKNAERLSRAYPIEWARKVHFPVMIYFVIFIVIHVALVVLTGFLRNLNHMYASTDAAGWTGFWVFLASLVVIALGWAAARPLVIAPIAKLFGTVSGR